MFQLLSVRQEWEMNLTEKRRKGKVFGQKIGDFNDCKRQFSALFENGSGYPAKKFYCVYPSTLSMLSMVCSAAKSRVLISPSSLRSISTCLGAGMRQC